jgi:hypothetical protein
VGTRAYIRQGLQSLSFLAFRSLDSIQNLV